MNFENKLKLMYQVWSDNQSAQDLQIFDAIVKLHQNQIMTLHSCDEEHAVLACLSSAIYLSNLNSFFEEIPQYLYDFYIKNKYKCLSSNIKKCFGFHVNLVEDKPKDKVINMFDFKFKKLNQIQEEKIISQYNY